MIITTRFHSDTFAPTVTIQNDAHDSGRPFVWLEFGPAPRTSMLMTVEQLRELEYLIDTALADHDRKPAPVIDSIPLFVGDASA